MRIVMGNVGYACFLVIVVGCGGIGTNSDSSSVSPERDYAQAIDAVLAQAEIAYREALKTHSVVSSSTTVRKILDAYKNIDLRECPADFQEAFLSYITTINTRLPFSEKYDDVSFYSAFVNTTEFFTLGPGRLLEVVEESNRLEESMLAAQQKVKEIGLYYNANVNREF